jgi:thiol-disulfide isomerase/thioredoxin
MGMRIGTPMPSFDAATDWVSGSAEEALASVAGQPTLVHFWSVSCGICKESMPRVADWRDRFASEGLRVVAIHMPRYPDDMDLDGVRAAVAEHGISEACAVDNAHRLRDAFQNVHGYVPAYYLFDAEGKLRGFAAGEKGLGVLSGALERALAAHAALNAAPSTTP